MTYAGIGSRSTPGHVLEMMASTAAYIAMNSGLCLQSGGASGADSAFESGCDKFSGPKSIFLPWRFYNGNQSAFFQVPEKAFDIASKFHPVWTTLSPAAKKLHARNALIILGPNLDRPVRFVLCYTRPGGYGGTGQGVRMAIAHKIPVFDFRLFERASNAAELARGFVSAQMEEL